MGFLDKIAGAWGQWSAECQQKYERFQNKSTEELVKIAKGEGGFLSDTSFSAKMAACKILQERGHNPHSY